VFDESLVVRVGVNSHIEPVDDGDPMFRHHLDLDAQQGSLAIEDFQVDGTLTDLVLGAAFLEAGMTGSTFAEVTNMHGIIGSTIASFDAPRVP
jgi:small ligand-binding sensory domain FIST